MADHDRERLRELSAMLLRLHRLLLERERRAYEDLHGAVPSRELFGLLLSDPQFVWLRALSMLIAQIDEVVDTAEAVAPETASSALREVRRLLKSEEPGEFRARYHEALQESAEVVMAHAAVSKLLSRL